jgi:hypothetical protein
MTSFLLVVLCVAAPPTWTNGMPSPDTTGQIEGQIVLYPPFPVQRAGKPAEWGVPGQVAVVNAAGAVVARIASDPRGRFHVDLPPGHYTLRLTSLRRPATSDTATSQRRKRPGDNGNRRRRRNPLSRPGTARKA